MTLGIWYTVFPPISVSHESPPAKQPNRARVIRFSFLLEHIQFSTSRGNVNIVRSNVWTSLPRLQILFLLAFQTTRLKLPNMISA